MVTSDDWRPSADWPTLHRRAALLRTLRAFLDERGCTEIDAPIAARGAIVERELDNLSTRDGDPFVGSPEASLKRALAAGSGDVYHLGHVFRAGEVGRWHNPEFCMLEWYRCGWGLQSIIDETGTLLHHTLGLSMAEPQYFVDVFQATIGLDPFEASTASLADAARQFGVAPSDTDAGDTRSLWIDCLMSLVVQPRLGDRQPVCLTHFPAADGVLTMPAADGVTALRFEVYFRGVELANGAVELTNAALADERMRANAECGDGDTPVDEHLLSAMRAGLPECAGVALGVDRLLALQLAHDDVASVMPFDWRRR
ncbi:EF-P lysine aminoacylase GenX [Salinisphaera sp. USBA-960]|uniref:amino acid--tRNA ligase-related protein n=1 Tax=Salinisphaera orenii TaxID=856731 RepID=UPI0013A656B2|nr:EF-P lysine aminoacylase GenX [Salifodinibacter halophilus]NNC26086.1 EF-P lysine aminoacylase GenX [Salifodinibacter halophilus]